MNEDKKQIRYSYVPALELLVRDKYNFKPITKDVVEVGDLYIGGWRHQYTHTLKIGIVKKVENEGFEYIWFNKIIAGNDDKNGKVAYPLEDIRYRRFKGEAVSSTPEIRNGYDMIIKEKEGKYEIYVDEKISDIADIKKTFKKIIREWFN